MGFVELKNTTEARRTQRITELFLSETQCSPCLRGKSIYKSLNFSLSITNFGF